jgi:hypothetical protein
MCTIYATIMKSSNGRLFFFSIVLNTVAALHQRAPNHTKENANEGEEAKVLQARRHLPVASISS